MLNIDMVLRAYIEAALWSTNDETGKPLEKRYSIQNVDSATTARMRRDCEAFCKGNEGELLDEHYLRQLRGPLESQVGYDFWLTRCGHGCGFWDGDWDETVGKRLSESCKRFGEDYLWISDTDD